MTDRTRRAVVVGTRFGRTYLSALADPSYDIELAGVLARGSQRSIDCAAHHRVPLFTSVDDLPDDIGMAGVVVGTSVVGGPGTELSKAIMARGIHVLQEHPLHHDDLAACIATAKRHGVAYRLNTLYVDLPPVARFVRAARHLAAESRPVFVDATAAVQLSYSLLDVLGAALGGLRPATFVPPAALPGRPFRVIEGELRGVPTTVRIQNQMDPSDPDSHAHLLHSITIGFEGGHLVLVDTHGPVLWCPRPNMPKEAETSVDLYGVDVDYLDSPSATVIGPVETPTYREILSTSWPAGVQVAFDALRHDIDAGRLDRTHLQGHLATARVWQEVTASLGYPDLLSGEPPRPRAADDLLDAVGAGR